MYSIFVIRMFLGSCAMMPPKSTRQGQACRTCHSRKIRCDIALAATRHTGSCSNCQSLGVPCVPHVRKRKRPATPSDTQGPVVGDKESPASGLGGQRDEHEPSYLGRANYLDTHVPIDEEDASQYPNSPPFKIPTKLWDVSDQTLTLDQLVPRSIRESLISSFMRKCRPWMPLVSSSDLHSIFRSESCPGLLPLSILVAGSKVSTAPKAAELGQRCYDLAKLRFYAGRETNTLSVIIGTIFLQWWNQSGPEHVSIDNSSFWLRIGVGLAHQVGLHKQPDHRDPRAALRRKVWWSLVSRDCQIATSHGRPRAIHVQDSDMRVLDSDDFDAGDADASLFVNFVIVTVILGDLTQACLRQDLSFLRRNEIERSLQSWLRDLPPEFHIYDRATRNLIPYNFRSRQLHVPYFVALIILFRQKTPDQCPPGISILAASFISGIYEEYLDWGDISFVAPPSIFYLMVASLVQASSHRFPALAVNKERELHVTDQAIHSLKQRFPTARGAERVLRSVSKVASEIPLHETTNVQLTPHERDFFARFGPELCSHWDLVLNSGLPTGMQSGRSSALFQPNSDPDTHPDTDAAAATGLNNGQPPHHMRPLGDDMAAADQGIGVDVGAGLEPNSWSLDSFATQYTDTLPSTIMGQWWCSDLIPEGITSRWP